ncbi:MAG: hypothetical protein KKD63_00765 [Proteobacteria bacterium]|nr:hypothetical protein [Desulfobulbaceae bacterium]MBU4151390.1 hypothetical protein [Pseudomonadota bacterium]MDP2104564.1 hypothetical protein [Desulfobulbaceae bacterium]
MKRVWILTLLSLVWLTACAVVPARHGHGPDGVMVVPLLPSVVVLDVEPFYFYSGFHYHYLRDRWYYSKSRRGPWFDLPRGHYPKEVRFKEKHRDKYRDIDKRRDKGRDRD